MVLIDRYFDDLVKCIIDDLTYDNLQCNYEEMTRNIAEPSVFHEWSQLYEWNYYDYCAGKLKSPEQYSKCPNILYTIFAKTNMQTVREPDQTAPKHLIRVCTVSLSIIRNS